MSVPTTRSSWLSLSPSMTPVGRGLRVRTNPLLRALSLWSYDREALIDPDRRLVVIRRRRWWLFQEHRRIRFSDIAHVDYASANVGSEPAERFRVALALRGTDEMVPIGAFRGEDSVPTDWLGAKLGEVSFGSAIRE